MTTAITTIGSLLLLAALALIPFAGLLFVAEVVLARLASMPAALALLLVRSLRRNRMRTSLTFVATFVLVFVVTLIWSFLDLFDRVTEAKAGEQKAIVTERWQFPSMMPWSYDNALRGELEQLPQPNRPTGYMTWGFYGGSLDPNKRTPENSLFMFVMDPDALFMLDEWHDPGKKLETLLQNNTDGILIGREKLASFNKKVGDTIKVTSMNFKGIDLDFKILAVLPSMTGRYDQSAIMNQKTTPIASTTHRPGGTLRSVISRTAAITASTASSALPQGSAPSSGVAKPNSDETAAA